MVLSIPPLNYQVGPFQELGIEIAALGHTKSLNIKMYRQSDLQALCRCDERMTRRSLMEAIMAWYPELQTFYKREVRNKNKYYHKMFEAIAVAKLYQER